MFKKNSLLTRNYQHALIFLILWGASCSLNIKRAEKAKPLPVDPGVVKETPKLPPEIKYQDLAPQVEQEQDVWEVDKVVVWMEGIGVDSFYYLGFLQEFEAQNFSLKKLIGTGSACWIAQSWASENKGSYAEWQSFKLNSWKVLEKGFLQRWTNGSSLNSFKKNMKTILPSRVKRLFKIKHDCPYELRRGQDWVSTSSSYLDLSEEFWIQLQIPQIVRDLDLAALKKRSGLKTVPPVNEAISQWFSFSNQHDLNTTLVLILSNPQVRREFSGRSSSFEKLRLESGLRVMRIELGHKILNSTELYRNFKKRRLFMLEGRQEAQKVLKDPTNREFMGLKLYP